MNTATPFEPFAKMPRLSREIIITEKIDGTNAQICIDEDGGFQVGSRKRWITPDSDNFGFARWAYDNQSDLMQLGVGRHFGEWWGSGIQRGYGMQKGEKRFSLFNVARWGDERPACCDVVPILHRGEFTTEAIDDILETLAQEGSCAAPGYMYPEGIIIFHTAANMAFKKTIHKDEQPKSLI